MTRPAVRLPNTPLKVAYVDCTPVGVILRTSLVRIRLTKILFCRSTTRFSGSSSFEGSNATTVVRVAACAIPVSSRIVVAVAVMSLDKDMQVSATRLTRAFPPMVCIVWLFMMFLLFGFKASCALNYSGEEPMRILREDFYRECAPPFRFGEEGD